MPVVSTGRRAVVGVDLQPHRVAVVVDEGTGTGAQPVGDGRRLLVPTAVADGRWGSTAAEAPGSARVGDEGSHPTRPWDVDPSTPAFLDGLHARVLEHLGRSSAQAGPLYAVAAPAGTPLPRLLGNAEVVRVDPADALLRRWWDDARHAGPAPAGAVVVACGWRRTTVAHYHRDDRGWRRADAGTTVGVGAHEWADRLAAEVLRRCREPLPADRLLAVDDALVEVADAVRAAPPGTPVRWWGAPRAEMLRPLTVSRDDLATWPEVVDTTAEIAAACLRSGIDDALLVVGGPGAAWPFPAAAARALDAPTWQSPTPWTDLALGAVACGRRGSVPGPPPAPVRPTASPAAPAPAPGSRLSAAAHWRAGGARPARQPVRRPVPPSPPSTQEQP